MTEMKFMKFVIVIILLNLAFMFKYAGLDTDERSNRAMASKMTKGQKIKK